MSNRTEKDHLGVKEIKSDALWGIHTQRALDNFRISSLKVPNQLVKAMAIVKQAACITNAELGYLPLDKSNAIHAVCEEIKAGRWGDQFPLDALQGGAGTSLNMNLNEVIANRAIEILHGPKGQYTLVHPIEDVNRHQSTNDVYPTALKIAAIYEFRNLSERIAKLQGAFQRKEKEFSEIVTIARTELQEAVPITLGAEFASFAEAFARDRWRAFKCEERLRVVNLGGTAIGTGMGAPQNYIFCVIEKLRELTGLGLTRGENPVDQTGNSDAFVEVSGILKAHASNLIKVANDLRMLAMTGEIMLPKMQTGSSIMPGKINPVILEAVIQTGLKVIANDLLITEATSRGSLQINEFMPLLALALLESLEILTNVNEIFSSHVDGIAADRGKCRHLLDTSHAIVTAFLPVIGYDKSSELLRDFLSEGGSNFREFLAVRLGKEKVDQALSPQALTSLGYKDHGKNT